MENIIPEEPTVVTVAKECNGGTSYPRHSVALDNCPKDHHVEYCVGCDAYHTFLSKGRP